MHNKKVIIIGAGLAGLSAASYLQKNGFETEMFEMHCLPGGLCTSWKRKDYLIDGSIHFMIGTSEGESTFRFWNGLIDMSSIDFVYYNNHCKVKDNDKEIFFNSNVNMLEKELLQKAPEDAKQINWFIKNVRKFLTIKFPTEKPVETMTFFDKLKAGKMILPYSFKMIKSLRMSNKQFISKLKNKQLKEAFKIAFINEQPIFSTMLMFVWRHNKQMGYPKGGAVKISTMLEQNYLNLGGKINYNSKVAEIITENNQAKGIILENENIHKADIVISAADGKSTICKIFHFKGI